MYRFQNTKYPYIFQRTNWGKNNYIKLNIDEQSIVNERNKLIKNYDIDNVELLFLPINLFCFNITKCFKQNNIYSNDYDIEIYKIKNHLHTYLILIHINSKYQHIIEEPFFSKYNWELMNCLYDRSYNSFMSIITMAELNGGNDHKKKSLV